MKVPNDEILLAKLIQNAKAFGLYACRYTNFRNSNNRAYFAYDPKKSIACCAYGAATLDPETARLKEYGIVAAALQAGNDAAIRVREAKPKLAKDFYEVGQAFFDACRKPRRK